MTGCPAPSGYGEDGVHSREAVKKEEEDRRFIKKKVHVRIRLKMVGV